MSDKKFYCSECGDEMEEDCDVCEDCSFDPDWYEDDE